MNFMIWIQMTIDNAKICLRLYLLKVDDYSKRQLQKTVCEKQSLSAVSSNYDDATIIWNYWLDHSNVFCKTFSFVVQE